MKNEKLIRIIPGKARKHKTETRVFAREIHESYCAQRGCRFFGKRAVQGVCFSSERFDGERDIWKWIDLKAKHQADERAYFHKLYRGKPKEYIRHLEAHYESAVMNWDLTLDELVQLRGENAILKDKLDKKKA